VFTLFNSTQFVIREIVEVEIELPAGTDASVNLFQLGGTSFRKYDSNGNEATYQLLEIKRNSTKLRRPLRDVPHGDTVDHFLIALQADLPTFGYTTYQLKSYKITPKDSNPYAYDGRAIAPVRNPAGSMRLSANSWDNGHHQLF